LMRSRSLPWRQLRPTGAWLYAQTSDGSAHAAAESEGSLES
jgi:hypothetical protein